MSKLEISCSSRAFSSSEVFALAFSVVQLNFQILYEFRDKVYNLEPGLKSVNLFLFDFVVFFECVDLLLDSFHYSTFYSEIDRNLFLGPKLSAV